MTTRDITRCTVRAAMVAGLVYGLGRVAAAAESNVVAKPSPSAAAVQPSPAPADLKVVRKVVEGKVVHVSKRAISVEYEVTDQGSYEMLLPLAGSLEVRGAASVADLKYGDQVKVGIEQSYRTGDDGQPVLVKTEALVIVLLARAGQAAPAEAAP